jgi:hypothetical protein
LEARAGIAETAGKLRAEPPWYFGIYNAAEPYSDEQRELERFEESSHKERTTRRIRDLYFAVSDAELRRHLIAKHREGGNFTLSYWHQELSDAAVSLEVANATHNRWWVWASISGIILLFLGFYLFGLIGALGGVLAGYLNGRRMEHEALRGRESAIADADRELKEAEQTWNEVRNQPQTFSQREAKTGEPDSDQRLRAV